MSRITEYRDRLVEITASLEHADVDQLEGPTGECIRIAVGMLEPVLDKLPTDRPNPSRDGDGL